MWKALSLILLAGVLFTMFTSPANTPKRYAISDDARVDNATFANTEEVITEHFHLDLELDFDTKIANGSNTLTMLSLVDGLTTVVLDVRALEIYNVKGAYGFEDWQF